MITTRCPTAFDASGMARLLNEIIEAGGTTALTRPVTGEDLTEWMAEAPDRSAWHVATGRDETILGFQWIAPNATLPPEAADIATFVQTGQTGLGIGSALFEATRAAARGLGYRWINANIRADNEGGLIYYQSRGFEDYGIVTGYEMANGQIVDKRLKRYNL
jgi:L-amino acid N-acyltransferase YncA